MRKPSAISEEAHRRDMSDLQAEADAVAQELASKLATTERALALEMDRTERLELDLSEARSKRFLDTSGHGSPMKAERLNAKLNTTGAPTPSTGEAASLRRELDQASQRCLKLEYKCAHLEQESVEANEKATDLQTRLVSTQGQLQLALAAEKEAKTTARETKLSIAELQVLSESRGGRISELEATRSPS